MNKTIGLQLAVYSLLLAGLSYLTHYLAPSLARPTLIAGLAGGGLCLVWSLRAIAGTRGKALPVLTLIPINYILLSQMFFAWAGESQEVPGRQTAAVVITALFALSMGMLIRIVYAGVVFDRQPASPAQDAEAKFPTSSKPAGHAGSSRTTTTEEPRPQTHSRNP